MHPSRPPLRSLPAALWLGLWLATGGCLPFGLGGTLDDHDLQFEDAVFFELRGTDPGTGTPFHRIELWLTPMEEPCEQLPSLLDELSSLRSQIDSNALPPETYCEAWESVMEQYLGLDPFWHAQLRMKALPRLEEETPETLYAYHDETSLELADSPNFDADILYYPTPDFDACADEFAGNELYAPTEYPALGGEIEIEGYDQDSVIETVVAMNLGEADSELFEGRSTAKFCIPAEDWPLSFGLGF